MTLDITSTANPKIKWLNNLHKPSFRRAEHLIVVEGFKEISAALTAGLQPYAFFSAPELEPPTLPNIEHSYTVSQKCFAKIAYRDDSDGVIGVFEEPEQSLASFTLNENPFIIVIEAVEKPGNLGAIIRTADGAGADAIIACDPRCDIWSPNVTRASVGTRFSTPLIIASPQETLAFLTAHTITPYAAMLSEAAKPYTQQDYTTPTAIVLGTEATGLTPFWVDQATPVIIPMHGKNDSLNVSVAAGILAYEVVRQRSV